MYLFFFAEHRLRPSPAAPLGFPALVPRRVGKRKRALAPSPRADPRQVRARGRGRAEDGAAALGSRPTPVALRLGPCAVTGGSVGQSVREDQSEKHLQLQSFNLQKGNKKMSIDILCIHEIGFLR